MISLPRGADAVLWEDLNFGLVARKRRQLCRVSLCRCRSEKADDRHRAVLRARRERPRGRAAKQRDELTAFHCPVSPVLLTER